MHQAWLLYRTMTWPIKSWLRNSLTIFWASRQPIAYWRTDEGQVELVDLLRSHSAEEVTRGLLTVASSQWGDLNTTDFSQIPLPISDVEANLFQEDHSLWHAAVWAWGLIYRRQTSWEPSTSSLDRILALWLEREALEKGLPIISFSFMQILGRPRKMWTPILTEEQKQMVRDAFPREHSNDALAALTIAFFSRRVCSEEELARRLGSSSRSLAYCEGRRRSCCCRFGADG